LARQEIQSFVEDSNEEADRTSDRENEERLIAHRAEDRRQTEEEELRGCRSAN